VIRFLHTADLHLGKPFGRFPEDLRGRLREARRLVVGRLAAAARAEGWRTGSSPPTSATRGRPTASRGRLAARSAKARSWQVRTMTWTSPATTTGTAPMRPGRRRRPRWSPTRARRDAISGRARRAVERGVGGMGNRSGQPVFGAVGQPSNSADDQEGMADWPGFEPGTP